MIIFRVKHNKIIKCSNMKFAVVLTILTISSMSYAKPPQAIVGGSTASAGEFPFLAALLQNGRQFCGGSIISDRHVLTAAHCVVDMRLSTLTVRVGSLYSNQGGRVYTVDSLRYHRDYNSRTSGSPNDIAVIKLTSTIQFDSYTNKIPLAAAATPSGASVTATGWGLRSADASSLPTNAFKVTLKTIDTATCRQYHSDSVYTTQVCVLGATGQGLCMGDSGGPLIYSGRVIGVVSWGLPCARGYPDVFTSVYHFNDWINRAMTAAYTEKPGDISEITEN